MNHKKPSRIPRWIKHSNHYKLHANEQNELTTVTEARKIRKMGHEKAAIKIQAAFRGHKTRTEMKKGESSDQTKQKQKNVVTTKINKSEEFEKKDVLDDIFDPNDKELCDAATKIQATFRGHLQRKLATDTKDQVDIDEITKKVAEELDIDLNDPELNKAATKIQASFRGHKTRKTTTN